VAGGLSNGLVDIGHSVAIVTTTSKAEPDGRLGRVCVQRFALDKWACRGPRLLRSAYVSTGLAAYVRRSAEQFDVVHVHTLYSFVTVTTARSARRVNVPYVISPVGSLDPYTHFRKGRFRKEAFQRLFHRHDLARAAAVHFLSVRERQLAEGFGIAAPKVVVGLGLSSRIYGQASQGLFRKKNPRLARSQVVMYLGRISYTKGLDLLVSAFAQIATRYPDAHLLLGGPDYEGYSEALAAEINRQGLSRRITFTGLLSEEDKVAALADADVFVLPSYTEAFGVALLEAMASALPVIVTERAALATIVQSSDAGIVTESSVSSLSAALALLLGNDELRRQLGARGRSLVEKQFSWNVVAREFAELYGSVATERVRDASLPVTR